MSEAVVDADIPTYPADGVRPLHPAAFYETLRRRGPVSRVALRSGQAAWLVTGYAEARQLLADPRISADDKTAGYPRPPVPPEMRADVERFISMIQMDAPAHTVRRRLIIPDFTVRRMESLRALVENTVDSQLADMLALGTGRADLVAEISVPVSFRVACALVGVSDAERDMLERNSRTMSESRTPADAATAVRNYLAFLSELVTMNERDPTDTLLGRFIVRNDQKRDLDHDDVVAMVGLLLGGGPASAVLATSYGMLAMLEHPDQFDRLRREPDRIGGTVEEVLRHASYRSGQQILRAATDDVELGGVLIRRGDAVVVLSGAANGDPAVFESPDTFDIDRDGRSHIAFGHGAHQCLAQHLGRIQLQVVLSRLAARLPGLRLQVPLEEVPFTPGPPFSVAALPVTW